MYFVMLIFVIMGLWSRGIQRSKTDDPRLEDQAVCYLKYNGHNMPLECWPKIMDGGNNDETLEHHWMFNPSQDSLEFKFIHESDTEIFAAILWEILHNLVPKSDCVKEYMLYDKNKKIYLYGVKPIGVSGNNVVFSIDYYHMMYGTVE